MIYEQHQLRHIRFPLGGIGSGSVSLAGDGRLVDFEIFNRPNKGGNIGWTFFAVRAEYPNGKSVVKVLQGDYCDDLTGSYTMQYGYGYGPKADTMCAFPHFKEITFDGKFPIAEMTFRDNDFPGEVILTAFNPFIPLNADDSSLPAAFFDIRIRSFEDGIKYTVVFSAKNPFGKSFNQPLDMAPFTAVMLKNPDKAPSDKDYCDLTIAADGTDCFAQPFWYRSRWASDKPTVFWRELTEGKLPRRTYDTPRKDDVCSVGASRLLNKEESHSFRFVYCWNMPNNYNYWYPYRDENGSDRLWKNYYAVLFEDSSATAAYALKNWDRLYEKTRAFCDALHSSTLDSAVIDAAASTLSVLKSPTVLRLEDGSFYGWEGVHEHIGSCEGTCTHVWSYAYALCFLFPELERSLRDVEFANDVSEHGLMDFRTRLPIGYGVSGTLPCVDGQMATVFKVYREWKISGDTEWLKGHWDAVKRILEFAWSEHNAYEWDRDKDGILEGRQHHTLDMELFGPSAWLQGMYLAALKAAAVMADALGESNKTQEYLDLFDKGYSFTKDRLFNGKYFIQQVDLTNKQYIDHFNCPQYWNEEHNQLKYQIGEGCEIDQLLGQWHAHLCGLGDIFDKEQRITALKNMYALNFKTSMRDFPNAWRVFVLNDEQGAIMCDYPKDINKPIIPVPYADECMTGFEYAFAGLLIAEGMIEEGLSVVRAIRDRYDGAKRNPFNEMECGSNYARAMASFALLPIFSGFEYDLPNHFIGFSPILPTSDEQPFKCLWSLQSAWGEFKQSAHCCEINLEDGSLELERVKLGSIGTIGAVIADGKKIPFTQNNGIISFERISVSSCIRFEK